MRLIDAHCHFHAYREEEYGKYEKITIIAVSEDYNSSTKTFLLSKKIRNIVPFVGLHPWSTNNSIMEELRLLKNLLNSTREVAGLGEVGLDFRFSKIPKDTQLKIFEEFCRIAAERNLPLNVHSYSAWSEALACVVKNEAPSVLFHWYTGPEPLLKEIKDHGYFISINPTATIQEKQRKIIEKASEEILLTESDGPYVYRSMRLDSTMILQTLEVISEIKKISVDEASQIISNNYERYMMKRSNLVE